MVLDILSLQLKKFWYAIFHFKHDQSIRQTDVSNGR